MAGSFAAVNCEGHMGRELEAKFRVPALEPVRQRLRARGARPAGPVLETNRIFDTPDCRLLGADCGLRVREAVALEAAPGSPACSATLTYKGPRAARQPKVREELETAVADAAELVGILQRLGFREVVYYEKRRETWRLGPCEIALDELPRLGSWIEIEGPDAAAIEYARTDLGLADTPVSAETYVELAATHGEADAAGCRRLVFGPAVGTV
jgi:adenylate cyclase class 2